MGINIKTAELLVSAYVMGANFESTCTLARLGIGPTPEKLAKLLKRYKVLPDNYYQTYTPLTEQDPNPYCEAFLQIVGAKHIDSIDNSSYENATIVHDMNVPIPDELKEKYDAVIDGGTLEHVFYFPTAIKNAMEMVKEGGRFYMNTCANNLFGHGFYQFDAELFYRIFSAENGFEVERMLIYEGDNPQMYEVVDPAKIGARVQLVNRYSTSLMVQAKRVKITKIFQTTPQQSDYVTTWTNAESAVKPVDPPYKAWLRQKLSPKQIRIISLYLNRLRKKIFLWRYKWGKLASIHNKKLYKPVSLYKQTILSTPQKKSLAGVQ